MESGEQKPLVIYRQFSANALVFHFVIAYKIRLLLSSICFYDIIGALSGIEPRGDEGMKGSLR